MCPPTAEEELPDNYILINANLSVFNVLLGLSVCNSNYTCSWRMDKSKDDEGCVTIEIELPIVPTGGVVDKSHRLY